ncbi:hypothetical protein BIW11_03251 [Tropilaelaps mercedesae]|uniref:Uncharacterized protein n=1 Tax=Tropilaelaps mercedesae TaxID=418985 RepID=A0A1V9XPT8_9ACAR|nr:hypothetical protein BIW11_03251 [Tropilaelaps mercedesae]
MGGYLGMWLGFSLFSILSGLEAKFQQFLVRQTDLLKGVTAWSKSRARRSSSVLIVQLSNFFSAA